MRAHGIKAVSTHSRPKAAGGNQPAFIRFDYVSTHSRPKAAGIHPASVIPKARVSTHSRPKAAGYLACADALPLDVVSTHSRPKAAGKATAVITTCATVSTHSRPKAAGDYVRQGLRQEPSFNTQPPEGGWVQSWQTFVHTWKFQHTAARRRLGVQRPRRAHPPPVSTHSRPKAAGLLFQAYVPISLRFNTQPPEGGWI